MLKRLIATIGLCLCLIPVPAALADNTIVADDMPVIENTPSPSPSPDSASGLGPQTVNSSGSASSDGPSLQPAGHSTLQSTTNDASGLAAPNANALQAPSTNDETLRVLMADGEGTHAPADDDSHPYEWIWLSLLIALIVAGAGFVMYSRRKWSDKSSRD